MSGAISHPLTGATFEVRDDGLIEVFDPESGTTGIFGERGDWRSGELTFADPHMIRWALDVAAKRGTGAMAVAGKRETNG